MAVLPKEIIDQLTAKQVLDLIMCKDCERYYADIFRCSVYDDPHKLMWARHGKPCPFNPPKEEEKKKKFVNPIKQSKRKR